MESAIPALPPNVCASALLHGSDIDFVTNAYLALQHQWPDSGGYGHYLYVLAQNRATRAQVLREIASSDNARRCGVTFIDDLPPDHVFRPEDHDSHRLAEMNLRLRLGRTVADVADLRRALGRLTTSELSGALEAFAVANQAQQAVTESRLAMLEAAFVAPAGTAALEAGSSCPSPAAAGRSEDAHWRHLAAQQMALQDQVADAQRALVTWRAEMDELRQAFAQLHHYATVELKRQVADYVNALSSAQLTLATRAAPAATVPRTPGRKPSRPAERTVARPGIEHG